MSKGECLAPQEMRIDLAVFPETGRDDDREYKERVDTAQCREAAFVSGISKGDILGFLRNALKLD
jgi:hypothetical protein